MLNDTRYVLPETAERVHAAIRELNYFPSSIAKSLRVQKTNTIGVLMPVMLQNISDAYNMQIAHGIRQGLKQANYNLILGSTENSVESELRQIQSFIEQRVDGLIVIPSSSVIDYLSDLQNLKLPMVFVDRKVKGSYGDCVLCDDYNGSCEAVNALISKGHGKIGAISLNYKVTTVEDRVRGYKSALRDAGIEIAENRILYGDCNFDVGVELMKKMIEQCDVTAVFVADNLLALGALSYIHRTSITIPDDLALIAFDDMGWEMAMRPTVSTVRQPAFDLGVKAAQLMLERLENPDKPFETCLLSTQLLLRESI